MSDTQTKTSGTADMLTKAATQYASAKAGDVINRVGQRASGGGSKQKDSDDKGFVGATTEKMGEGAGPAKAAVSGVGTSIKEKVTGLFKSKGGGKRPHNIVEDIVIGVPPKVCWDAYMQWEEFPSFMKGPTSVNRGDDDEQNQEGEETDWTAKIFMSTRSWKATTTDFDEPNRLAWKSEGAKGTVDGTITFTPLGENATLLTVVIEYRSKGPVEWMGQRWHTVGKRVRLDLKHFRRYVMRTDPDEFEDAPEQPAEEKEQEQGQETRSRPERGARV